MDFVVAFKEAKEAGMSTDQFMALWQLKQKRETEEMDWQRKKEERQWLQQMTEGGKTRTKPPQVRRQGYVDEGYSRDAVPTNCEAAVGDIVVRYESNGPVAPPCSRGNNDEETPKPVKRPLAKSRHQVVMKSEPPAYEEADSCQRADGEEIEKQTLCKFPQRADNLSMSSSDDDNKQDLPISGTDTLSRIEHQQQTECKSPGPPRHVQPASDHEGGLSKEEQTVLTNTLKKLQEEQEKLKARLTEHTDQLETLLSKQADNLQSGRKVSSTCNMDVLTQGRINVKGPKATEDLYVQIEQLYVNLCKMRMPSNAVHWMHRFKQVSIPSGSKDDSDDQFSTRVDSAGYWDIASVKENMALQKENEELKENMREMEGTLRQHMQEAGPGTKPCDVNFKPSPTDPANFVVVAGCPEQCHSGEGTVRPVDMSFKWFISHYSIRREKERSGRVLKTVSKPFYISHCGYLAQLEVFLNGDNGQGKFISLFLRVIKGDYDQHLQWPLRLTFVVVLTSQAEGRPKDIIPQAVAQCTFNRPSGCSDGSSQCAGFLQLVTQSAIVENKLIRNDSLFFNIKLKMRI